MRERGGHAVVLEAAGWIHPLVLQVEPPRFHADKRTDAVRLMQNRLPLADSDDAFRLGERKQLMEPPDAAETERLMAAGPGFLEPAEAFGNGPAVPVVLHVQQVPALGARHPHFLHATGIAAGRADAALEGKIGEGHGWKGLRGKKLLRAIESV